jgi:LacI family transcriptional regulator/LacI family repressor for deo operon, udp, cdd, tsx, nupC, and nupG
VAVTIKDIARLAGVTHSTVSRALHGNPAIAAETVARISQIANDLGYVPSAVARGLKTNRSNAIGLIVSRIDDPFIGEILHGIEEVSQAAGYSLFVAASHRDSDREQVIVRAMGERRVDGLIVCSTHFGKEHERKLMSYGIPIVALDNQALSDYQYSIYHDDFFGSQQATQHLINLGHEKVAFLGNEEAGRTTQDRLEGYCQALKNAGLSPGDGFIFLGPNGRPEGGIAGTQHFLRLDVRPSAIVCFNDMMAVGVLHALKDAGLHVPNSCSVVGFDNIPITAYSEPPLTTFEQPKYQLGIAAAQMMIDLLVSAHEGILPAEPETRILKGRMVIRESTAPPPMV